MAHSIIQQQPVQQWQAEAGTQQQEPQPNDGQGNNDSSGEDRTFTQADVDKIVRDRVKRERDKYSDYDDLKAKASEAKTAEDRIAELEKQYKASEASRLRSDVAAKHGISTEDRDLFLTGSDEETLTAQAKRLADRDSERRSRGNVAPTEGGTDGGDTPSNDMREFTRNLFARSGD